MASSDKTLNQVFSKLSARRRYEVWFLRVGMMDGTAWWFRYLLTNPGRGGCAGIPLGMPVQVWATYFQAGKAAKSFIQGFSVADLHLSGKAQSPFHFAVNGNVIDDNGCRGQLNVEGHEISWDLRYQSSFCATLSHKGWIGFSQTPHSDAQFSGRITLDGKTIQGQPLGFGVQGHNCGYRHRNFWAWTHAYFAGQGTMPSTFETLIYEMPLGLIFRKAILWHEGNAYVFKKLREKFRQSGDMNWNFSCLADQIQLDVEIDGSGPALHRLQYVKTDCSESFEVRNNSIAKATIHISQPNNARETLTTQFGAVLEMAGQRAEHA